LTATRPAISAVQRASRSARPLIHWRVGRAGPTGRVTSGRRWHERVSSVVHGGSCATRSVQWSASGVGRPVGGLLQRDLTATVVRSSVWGASPSNAATASTIASTMAAAGWWRCVRTTSIRRSTPNSSPTHSRFVHPVRAEHEDVAGRQRQRHLFVDRPFDGPEWHARELNLGALVAGRSDRVGQARVGNHHPALLQVEARIAERAEVLLELPLAENRVHRGQDGGWRRSLGGVPPAEGARPHEFAGCGAVQRRGHALSDTSPRPRRGRGIPARGSRRSRLHLSGGRELRGNVHTAQALRQPGRQQRRLHALSKAELFLEAGLVGAKGLVEPGVLDGHAAWLASSVRISTSRLSNADSSGLSTSKTPMQRSWYKIGTAISDRTSSTTLM